VGDKDEAETVTAPQLLQQVDDVGLGVFVEVARRLIGEQQGGRVDQDASDRHPALLAAGQAVGICIGAV